MRITGIALACTAALAFFCLTAYGETAVIDRILATVNGEIITLSEFERYKALLYMGQEKQSGREAESQMLNTLIEKKLVLQQAKKLEIEVKEKEIEAAVEDILKRNNISLQGLKEELAKQGATLEEYKQLLKDEIVQSHVVGRQVHAKINITDKDIEDYQVKTINQKEKTGPRVRIQQILLLVPNDSSPKKTAEIERSAVDLQKKIAAGGEFEKMAATYSQGAGAQAGGDIGYFQKGELMPEIESAAFSLEKGQVSQVLRTSLGFHIIRVIDKDSSGQAALSKERTQEIRGMIYNAAFEKVFKEWFEGIKEKSYIEVNF